MYCTLCNHYTCTLCNIYSLIPDASADIDPVIVCCSRPDIADEKYVHVHAINILSLNSNSSVLLTQVLSMLKQMLIILYLLMNIQQLLPVIL